MIRTYVMGRDIYRAMTGYDEKKEKRDAQKKQGDIQSQYPSKGSRTSSKEYAEGSGPRKAMMGDS